MLGGKFSVFFSRYFQLQKSDFGDVISAVAKGQSSFNVMYLKQIQYYYFIIKIKIDLFRRFKDFKGLLKVKTQISIQKICKLTVMQMNLKEKLMKPR